MTFLFFFLISFLVSPPLSFAQQNPIDSLQLALKNARHDTTRLTILNTFIENENDEKIWQPVNEQMKILSEKLIQSNNKEIKLKGKKGLADALNNTGYIYDNQGQIKSALVYYSRSLKIKEEIGDKAGIANSLTNIGYIYNNQGQIKLALDYYSRSLKIQEEFGDKMGIATTLNNIGYIYDNQGQIKTALSYYGRSLKIRKEIGDKAGIAVSLTNIGYIYNNQCQIKTALDYYGKSLKIMEEIGDKMGIAYSLNNIGLIYKNQGLLKESLDYFGKSLKIKEETGDKTGIANSLNNIGSIFDNQGQIKSALDYYGRSLKILEEIGDKAGIAKSLNNIGAIYEKQLRLKEALVSYGRSLKILEEIGDKMGIAYSLNNIGSIYLKEKKYVIARSYTDSSLAIAKKIGFIENLRDAEKLLGEIDFAQGNLPQTSFPNRVELAFSSLAHYKQYIIYRDSIKNKENERAAIRQQMKYEFEKAMIIKEQKEKEEKGREGERVKRRNRLQYSAIFIGILLLFGIVFMLGRFHVPVRVVEFSVFMSFLLLFEFLLVFLDPQIDTLTGSMPILKLIINALLAGAIFPVHGFFERFIKRRLFKKRLASSI